MFNRQPEFDIGASLEINDGNLIWVLGDIDRANSLGVNKNRYSFSSGITNRIIFIIF